MGSHERPTWRVIEAVAASLAAVGFVLTILPEDQEDNDRYFFGHAGRECAHTATYIISPGGFAIPGGAGAAVGGREALNE
jgi:hypothetical protein